MEGGRWLKIDWEKVMNSTDTHLAFWEEAKAEPVTAEVKVEPDDIISPT